MVAIKIDGLDSSISSCINWCRIRYWFLRLMKKGPLSKVLLINYGKSIIFNIDMHYHYFDNVISYKT